MIKKIKLSSDNRMLRIGGGYHSGTPFFRIDLWWVGYRIGKFIQAKDDTLLPMENIINKKEWK